MSRSPLEEVERTVQERSTAEALDVDTEHGRARLRQLVDEAVAEWDEDHRRGRRLLLLRQPDRSRDRPGL